MKATGIRYARARTLPEAFDLLALGGADARPIAGGQSLVAALNLRLADDVALVDINDIAELRGIAEIPGGLRIGALTRHAELGASPLVARHAPALAQAVPLIAHAAIRTRGTLGGSLAHADPAAELPACALALQATLVLHGPGGERRVVASDFFQGLFLTALTEGEIIAAVEVPSCAVADRQTVRELARRSGDYALVGVVAATRGAAIKLAYFGVADTPVLARRAMAALDRGASLEEACAALGDDLAPQTDLHATAGYRRHLAEVLLRRAVADLRDTPKEGEAAR